MAVEVPKAPPGFAWVYNRLPKAYEAMFDFKLYQFAPNETRLMPDDVALFLTNNSVIKVDLTTSSGVRALVSQHDDGGRLNPLFGQPYSEEVGDEAIDRSKNDNPMGWGTREGVKTRAVRVPIGATPQRASA